jgi:hypothetical protein
MFRGEIETSLFYSAIHRSDTTPSKLYIRNQAECVYGVCRGVGEPKLYYAKQITNYFKPTNSVQLRYTSNISVGISLKIYINICAHLGHYAALYRSFGTTLTLQDETDMLSRNVGIELPLNAALMSQNSTVLIYNREQA